jgi:hypothetical protein
MSFELEPTRTKRTPKTVRITQLDGKLPNLALMRLSHYHRSQGDTIVFRKAAGRDLFEPDYDIVYASAIFTSSAVLVDRLRRDFPGAIVGGPGAYGYRDYDPETFLTVEKQLGVASYEHYDYSIYPDFDASLGYTQRGCRFACEFCPVPKMEGKPRAVATLEQIWRGPGYPKHLHLLDNDHFALPRAAMIDEMIAGGYKVCINQGINVRVINEKLAAQIARIPYYDDNFKRRTLYTAWDNIGDEKPFVDGCKKLFAAGVKPDHVVVYMLCGFDQNETLETLMYRFNIMNDMGVRPYPMPFMNADGQRRDLKMFQKWVVTGSCHVVPFSEFRVMSQTEREHLHRLNRERAQQLELLALAS